MVDTALYHLMPKKNLEETDTNAGTSEVDSNKAVGPKGADQGEGAAKSSPQERGSALYKLVSILGS